MEEKKVIYSQTVWDTDFERNGRKVTPGNAMYYEMEKFYPSYALVVTDAESAKGRIAFFFRDDKPYNQEGEQPVWHTIQAQYVESVRERIKNQDARLETRYGVAGHIVPLQESTFFTNWEDVNTYLHNLMYWESVMASGENGPLTQRIVWLTHKAYELKASSTLSLAERILPEVKPGIPYETDENGRIIVLQEKVAELLMTIERMKEESNMVSEQIRKLL